VQFQLFSYETETFVCIEYQNTCAFFNPSPKT